MHFPNNIMQETITIILLNPLELLHGNNTSEAVMSHTVADTCNIQQN